MFGNVQITDVKIFSNVTHKDVMMFGYCTENKNIFFSAHGVVKHIVFFPEWSAGMNNDFMFYLWFLCLVSQLFLHCNCDNLSNAIQQCPVYPGLRIWF